MAVPLIPLAIGAARAAAPSIARLVLRGLSRSAPQIANAYIMGKVLEQKPVAPAVYNERLGTTDLPPDMASAQWKVPIINSQYGSFAATPITEKEARRNSERTYSAEALRLAYNLVPPAAVALAGSPGTVVLGQGSVLDCEPGVDKEKDRLATALAIIADVTAACDVIVKHDPTPGSLGCAYMAEEMGNVCLSDPLIHECLRKEIFGDLGVSRGRMTNYNGIVPQRLDSRFSMDSTTLSDPTGARYELYTGNRHPYDPQATILTQVPRYKVVHSSLLTSLTPRWNTVTPSLGQAKAQYSFDGVCCDSAAAFQTSDRHLKDGEFYRTPTFVASVGDTDPGVYGQTRIDVLPFEITISNQNIPQRALISFVHEALHGYDELHKLGIGHDQLHSLAVYLTQEAVPAYLRLAQQLNINDNGILS